MTAWSQPCKTKKRERVAKNFSAFVTQDADEVMRLMEDEEFWAWCDKNLSDDSLDKYEGEKLYRGGGDVDKISYLQLIHNFPQC